MAPSARLRPLAFAAQSSGDQFWPLCVHVDALPCCLAASLAIVGSRYCRLSQPFSLLTSLPPFPAISMWKLDQKIHRLTPVVGFRNGRYVSCILTSSSSSFPLYRHILLRHFLRSSTQWGKEAFFPCVSPRLLVFHHTKSIHNSCKDMELAISPWTCRKASSEVVNVVRDDAWAPFCWRQFSDHNIHSDLFRPSYFQNPQRWVITMTTKTRSLCSCGLFHPRSHFFQPSHAN